MRKAYWFLASLVLAGGANASTPGTIQKKPMVVGEACERDYCIALSDMTPRFLAFYDAARTLPANDTAARHAAWKAHYGFAAVPPGPKGEAMARTLLEQGWPRYARALPHIRKGAGDMAPDAAATLARIATLLRLDAPYKVQLIAFVGAFEENAFTAGQGGTPFIAMPVEIDAQRRATLLAHEMTHAVQMGILKGDGGWERSIATTIVQEGLAMHISRAIAPGQKVRAYVEHTPGWWDVASARRATILRNILPALDRADSDSVFRFTIGEGPSGLEREAYAAGWLVIEQLRAEGMDWATIARIPEAEHPAMVRRAIEALLARS